MKVRHFVRSLGLPAAPLARWASICFSLSVLTFLISLAASQGFFALAGVFYAAHLLRRPVVPSFPPIKLPLALFCVTTIISIEGAENPVIGWLAVRKLVLFLILLLAVNLIASVRHLVILYKALFFEAAVAGLVAITQFIRQYDQVRIEHPQRIYFYMTVTRISGFMGHWMNFGGQQMLVFAALLAFLLLAAAVAARLGTAGPAVGIRAGRPARAWWLIGAIVGISIVLNFTRGVWLGCFLAIVYVVARWRARWLWLLPLLAAAAYLSAPGLVRQRLRSVVHPSADPSVAVRFEMMRVGLNMIERHPWVGVGPDNVNEVYLMYMPAGERPITGYHAHLHDDLLQFAAERGLPCLAAWVWFMVALLWYSWRIRRRLGRAGRPTWLADAALAAWLAFVAEGFFEYNFGTSPVLMVFLFVAATPFVLAKVEGIDRRVKSGINVLAGSGLPTTGYR